MKRYETLMGTIGKKFAKKRDRLKKNGAIKLIKTNMVLKPQD